MMRMRVPSVLDRFERELAGNTTPTDPRSQRIRASRKGRPCNELGLAAQRLSAACPHLCAPGTPIPDGLTITRFPKEAGGHRGTEIIMPDNGICERFHRTVLDEFYRIAFRKKIYHTINELQTDLDTWLVDYNQCRLHQGRWCFGKTPMQSFLDALPLAKEKIMAA
jgi:Integrase core domain